jgi:2-iminobutanoate/2-iminopropanoate deaminase
MSREVFHGEGVARFPAPLSQAMGGGGLLFLSGQVPFDENGEVDGADIETQARRVFDNMRRNLAAAGCGFSDVLKVNAFLSSLEDAPGYNRVYEEVFPEPYPARTTVGAALPGFLLEVEAVALRRSGSDGRGDADGAQALVMRAYDAWDAEDDDSLARLLAADAEAHQEEALPWGGAARGRAAFLRYTRGVKEQLDATADVDALFRCGDDIVAMGRSAGRVRATGGRFDVRFAHVWTVRDGLITRFVAYVDTDALAGALETG